jgi:hypothetical protein
LTKPLITKEFISEVKEKATWEVTEYDENMFKGINEEDITSDSVGYAANNLRQSEEYYQPNTKNGLDCGLAIQNMGDKCAGSTFAFAVAGMVTMRCCAKQGKKLEWLSPMELISCDSKNYGCAGGWPINAVEYVKTNGLVPEACYPYSGSNEPCPNRCKNGKVWKDEHVCKVVNPVNLRSIDDVKKALAGGPVVVSFEAFTDLYTYKSGVYCHVAGAFKRVISVTVLAYADQPSPHLLMQVPFGNDFGEKGLLRMCYTCCSMFGKYEKGNVAVDIA